MSIENTITKKEMLDPAIIGAIKEFQEKKISGKDFSDMVLANYLLKDIDPKRLAFHLNWLLENVLKSSMSAASLREIADSYIEKSFTQDEAAKDLEPKVRSAENKRDNAYNTYYMLGEGKIYAMPAELSGEERKKLSEARELYESANEYAKEIIEKYKQAQADARSYSLEEQILEKLIIPYFEYFKK